MSSLPVCCSRLRLRPRAYPALLSANSPGARTCHSPRFSIAGGGRDGRGDATTRHTPVRRADEVGPSAGGLARPVAPVLHDLRALGAGSQHPRDRPCRRGSHRLTTGAVGKSHPSSARPLDGRSYVGDRMYIGLGALIIIILIVVLLLRRR